MSIDLERKMQEVLDRLDRVEKLLRLLITLMVEHMNTEATAWEVEAILRAVGQVELANEIRNVEKMLNLQLAHV